MPGSGRVVSPASMNSLAGVEESGLPLHNLTASTLLSTKMGTLRKMPVTHTLTGTLYYKKCFKEASKSPEPTGPPTAINEQRPRGDGAPAKVVRRVPEEKGVKDKAGKSLKAAQLEFAPEDDEEDDLSTPSG
nr:hypothetical protein BaRGS_004429 [Batillaria attramentaria]